MRHCVLLFFYLMFGRSTDCPFLVSFLSKTKLSPPFLKPASAIYTFLSVAFVLLVVGGIVYAFVEESSWILRTREVSVYVKPENWMTGEIKSCASAQSKEKEEIGVLLCDQNQMLFEPHVLQVRFWGPIKPDRNKEWKCTREAASLTCRLQ